MFTDVSLSIARNINGVSTSTTMSTDERTFQTEETKVDENNHSLPDVDALKASVGITGSSVKAHRCSHKCLVATSVTQLLLILGLVTALILLLFLPKDSQGDNVVTQLRYSTNIDEVRNSVIRHVRRVQGEHPEIMGEDNAYEDKKTPQGKALQKTIQFRDKIKNLNMAITVYTLWSINYELSGGRSTSGMWTNDDADICLWDGVRCDFEGKVAVLDIEDRGMQGDLPAEIWLLKDSLTGINVKDNANMGRPALPTFLYKMPKLNYINVCGTVYGGLYSSTFCKRGTNKRIYADFDCDCCVACGVIDERGSGSYESGYTDEDGDGERTV